MDSLIKAAYSVLYESEETHIDVDGQMRPRRNKDGDLIHPTEEGTRNFYRWFGDSINTQSIYTPKGHVHGFPQVFYHETETENVKPILKSGFDTNLNKNRLTDEQMPDGVFLKSTPNPIGVSRKETSQIPVYSRAKNPAWFFDRDHLEKHMMNVPEYAQKRNEYSEINRRHDRNWNEVYNSKGMDHNTQISKMREITDAWGKEIDQKSSEMRSVVTNHLKSLGHDSIFVNNDRGSRGRETNTHVVFDSGDIKHAKENSGEFGKSNSITESQEIGDDIYPIQETPSKKRFRENAELNSLVLVDANKLKDKFEEEHNESLSWNQSRLNALRDVVGNGSSIDSYPEVSLDHTGKISIGDGRHRISHAAELGKKIYIATRKEFSEAIKSKVN